MSLDVDLRTRLAAVALAPVQQNYLSTDQPQPFVLYQRQSGQTDVWAGGASGMTETTYAVEVAGLDVDAAAAVAGRITAQASEGGLDGFRGFMGNSFVLGVFVEDLADDYQRRALDLDDGFHVFGFNLRILT